MPVSMLILLNVLSANKGLVTLQTKLFVTLVLKFLESLDVSHVLRLLVQPIKLPVILVGKVKY